MSEESEKSNTLEGETHVDIDSESVKNGGKNSEQVPQSQVNMPSLIVWSFFVRLWLFSSTCIITQLTHHHLLARSSDLLC